MKVLELSCEVFKVIRVSLIQKTHILYLYVLLDLFFYFILHVVLVCTQTQLLSVMLRLLIQNCLMNSQV